RWRALASCAVTLLGGRPTLIHKILALLVAAAMIPARWYVVEEIFRMPAGDWAYVWPIILPVAVMLIVRNRYFSYVFFSIYVVLAFSLGREIWLIQIGQPGYYSGPAMGFSEVLFYVLSVICLASYLGLVAIRILHHAWTR